MNGTPTRSRKIRRLSIAGALVAAVALAACGGGDADAPESIPEPSYGDIALPSTLPGPTTTLPAPEV
ncbi:MAG: hypothetical protein ACKOA5_07845, partial [Actinomycetota bacterium]